MPPAVLEVHRFGPGCGVGLTSAAPAEVEIPQVRLRLRWRSHISSSNYGGGPSCSGCLECPESEATAVMKAYKYGSGSEKLI